MSEKLVKALKDELIHAKINYDSKKGTLLMGDYGNGYVDGIESSLEVAKEHLEPQLNENQQKWFDRLSSNYSWHENVIEHALYTTLTENDLPVLSRKEFSGVIINFADMVLKGEAHE